MTIIAQNFSVCPGDTKQITVDVVDRNGAAIESLEDYVAEIVWAGAGITKRLTMGGVVLMPGDSRFVITLLPADTTALLLLYVGYEHACTITDKAGNVSTAFRGIMRLPARANNTPVALDGQVDDFATVTMAIDFSIAAGSQWAPVLF